jgi:hypothetical protein
VSLQRAFQRLLVADNVKAVLAVDAPAVDTIEVPVADWTKFYVDAQVLVKSSVTGSAASNLAVVRVHALTVATHRISIEPALPAALKATDELRLGVVHWVKGGSAVLYRRPAYSTPVQDLLDVAAAHETVVLYGELPRRNVFAESWEGRWEFRAIGKSPRHAEGCAERVKRILHGQSAALRAQAKGITCGGLVASDVEEGERTDTLYEWIVRATVDETRKVA